MNIQIFLKSKTFIMAVIAFVITMIFSHNLLISALLGAAIGFLSFILTLAEKHEEILRDTEDEK